jgi:hypothetical protein
MRRIKLRVRLTAPSRKKMPKQVESGPVFSGWRGHDLQKGTQVIRHKGRIPGTIKEAGPQQSEVQWLAGPTQTESNNHLQRLDTVRR